MEKLAVTDRTRLRRHPERGDTDRAALDAILDAGWVAHVGFAGQAAQPFVIPTTYVRIAHTLYIHGAVASRMLRAGAQGIDLCATVTLIDGLVLARSAFHHSMNYRSAVIVGRARLVEDDAEKARALAALVDRLIPGRNAVARPPEAQELKQTAVLALPLEEASVKVRSGPPIDREDDLGWPAWAGVIPLAMTSGAPEPAAGAVGAAPARTLAGPTPAAHAAETTTTIPPPTAAVEQRFAGWVLSDDRARVDFARVSAWLTGAYWCRGIPRAAVEQAARHSSLVAGAYDAGGAQIGYLRVVSDRTRFANLMDVFVAEPHRRLGLGRALVRFALAHPAHRAIPRWLLGTNDAHGVYAHEGFRPLDAPERLMQRVKPAVWDDATG
jgi:nitroimidazol reductase NimA-like FMN-containing flavoprotein (pyridoxamine 5'-phosphate oxidase superfamily)/GNAT superfamily N-acetyltransferase